jgi:hypothetical protein
MRLSRALAFILGGSALLSLPPAGQASSLDLFGLYCAPFIPGGGSASPPQTCGETAVGGTGPGDPTGFNGGPTSPDFVTSSGGTSSTAGGGGGGMSGTATAIAGFGLLRATAVASSPHGVGTEPEPGIASRALVSFSDAGSIVFLGGSPVLGRARLKVEGAFGGAADASVQLLIGSGLGGTLVQFESSLLAGFSSVDRAFDLPGLAAGDLLTVSLVLRAGANAGASRFSAVNASVADLGNSAHLCVDFETPGASWDPLSGHDYRLSAVPLPAGFWLLGTALIGLARFRRRAGQPGPIASSGARRAVS